MRTRATVQIVTALSLVGLLSGCGAPFPTPTPTPTVTILPSGDGTLRIGTLAPITGPLAAFGPAQVAGVEVAVRELNEAGGVAGAPVEVFHRDSGDTVETAQAAFSELIAKGVDVIVGPSSAALAEALAPSAAEAGVALVALAADPVGGEAPVPSVVPGHELQAWLVADRLAGDAVALVHLDDDAGARFARVLEGALPADDDTPVTTTAVGSDTTELAPTIRRIVRAKPDAVVLDVAPELATALLGGLLDAGLDPGELWLTSRGTADYSQAFAPGALEGVHGILDRPAPDEAFAARLRQSDPGLGTLRYAAEAYDAVMLAALAAIVADDDGGASIAAALPSVSAGGIRCTSLGECLDVLEDRDDIDYDGRSGPVDLNVTGTPERASYGLCEYDAENRAVRREDLVVGGSSDSAG